MDFRLRKSERIYLRKDFKEIYSHGNRVENSYIKILYKSQNDKKRMAIVVKRNLGKAHDRNKLRRRIREIYRLNKHKINDGVDIIFIPKKTMMSLGYWQINEIILQTLNKAGLLRC